jgi:hypothetical protein
MATQRVILAKIGGVAADVIAQRFRVWEQSRQGDEFPVETQLAVDKFAESLGAHAAEPPVVYFSQWIGMWSMGNLVPELGSRHAVSVCGRRYCACCHQKPIRFKPEIIADEPTQESDWLRRRLKEARHAWDWLVSAWVIVVLREPLGPLVEDDEIANSLQNLPAWLAEISEPGSDG